MKKGEESAVFVYFCHRAGDVAKDGISVKKTACGLGLCVCVCVYVCVCVCVCGVVNAFAMCVCGREPHERKQLRKLRMIEEKIMPAKLLGRHKYGVVWEIKVRAVWEHS